MKLCCFFISLVFISVWADYPVEYRKTLFSTNLTIQHNQDGMEIVIMRMVTDKNEYKDFGLINFMLAVPDKTEIVRDMRVPEMHNPNEITIANHYQAKMRQEIATLLGRLPPRVNPERFMGRLDTEALAKFRRELILNPLANITKQISNQPVDADILLQLCRSIGIFLSVKFPTSYIRNIETNPTLITCILFNGTKYTVYRKLLGLWRQVKRDAQTKTVQPLVDQLNGEPIKDEDNLDDDNDNDDIVDIDYV